MPVRNGVLPYVAGAATLFAAAPLWPNPSSRITWASVLFLAAVGLVAYYVARTATTTTGDVTAGARNAVLLVLLVVVPLYLDLRVTDSFNLPKFTVVLIGALVLAAVWAVEAVRPGSRPLWRNGLHWPVVALVGWTAVATATSVSPRMSILGAMGTNDGLLAAAAFAVIFFATVQAVSLDRVQTLLSVLYFGAGGPIVLYGLIQIHDRLVPGSPWDWVRHFSGGATKSFADGGIFATFGNPNHLAGFLAILAPIGLALFLLHTSRRLRVLVLAILAGALVELLQSASRGALLAALAGVGLTTGLLWPDLKRRVTISLPVVGTAAASVVIAALAFIVVPQSSAKFSSILDPGATVSVRAEIWEAGLAMANARPLVGHGPDTWVDRVPKYRDAESAERGGPGVLSNSAHNLFISQLAFTGYPGLVVLVALLAVAAMRAVGSWKRLRQIENASDENEASRARSGRLLLAGVVGGLVAYLVQASFNVSQIGLSFVFWIFLGLLCVVSLATGVPVSLRARALVGRPVTAAHLLADLHSPTRVRRIGKGATTEDSDLLASRAIAVLVCTGLVVAVSFVSRPYRADHNEWAARADSASASLSPPDEAERLARRAGMRRNNAIELNPWEPSYMVTVADGAVKAALSHPDGSSSQIAALQSARSYFERVLELRPHTVPYLRRYADILLKLHEVNPAAGDARNEAIMALQRAVNADPANHDTREHLEFLVPE